MEKAGIKLTHIANWVVRLVGSGIFLALVWYSLRFTQYMVPLPGAEFPVDIRDSEWQNLLALLLVGGFLAGGFWLEKRVSERAQLLIGRITLLFSMLWQTVWGYLWITAAARAPKGDQLQVYRTAQGFLEGSYHALGANGYCELYPHQLGLAAVEEVLFRILGGANYYAIQLLLVLMLAGIVLAVYGILRELSKHSAVVVTGTLLAGFCVVPIFYSCWLYGEIPNIFFAMLAMWALMRYVRRGRLASLAGAVAAMIMAVLVRKNALILVIAFCLVGALGAWIKKDKGLLIAVVVTALLPSLCYSGIYKIYEIRSGYEHAQGMPSTGFIYMGLQETEGRFGWYYMGSAQVYYDNDRDSVLAKEAYKQLLVERLQTLKANPGYAAKFLKGKILSQWNAPLYQSLYFNYVHEDVRYGALTEFFDSLSGEALMRVLWWMDRLQFVVYAGVLLYFMLCVKPDSNPLQHLLAVTIIGGFLFSILWEAKTRYVFPYYMLMFPMAVLGLAEALKRIRRAWANLPLHR